jgi:hypothetical protein
MYWYISHINIFILFFFVYTLTLDCENISGANLISVRTPALDNSNIKIRKGL